MGLDRCYTPFTIGLWGAMIFMPERPLAGGDPLAVLSMDRTRFW